MTTSKQASHVFENLIAQCTTDAERFAVGAAYYAGVTTQPDRVDIYPGIIRIRVVRTTESDTVYFVRNEGFNFLCPLWHRRWTNPGPAILRRARQAGSSHRK